MVVHDRTRLIDRLFYFLNKFSVFSLCRLCRLCERSVAIQVLTLPSLRAQRGNPGFLRWTFSIKDFNPWIASSLRSSQRRQGLDCFVTTLLAKTARAGLLRHYAPRKDCKGWIASSLRSSQRLQGLDCFGTKFLAKTAEESLCEAGALFFKLFEYCKSRKLLCFSACCATAFFRQTQ